MALLTAFTTLLARYTAQWDVVIGTPVAGRERPEIEGIVGFFLNNLVLRCRLDGSLAFTEALARVRDVCKEAFGHQELPFEELVAELAPERDLSRTPLYQVAFDYHDVELTGSAADAADLDAVADVSTIAKTDLTLYMRKQPDGSVIGALEYATALFDHATVERMAGHFQHLLAAAATDPQRRLDALDLLSASERGDLERWSHRPAPEVTSSVPALFARRAAAVPGATALVAGPATATFAELDERSNRLARQLRALGVGPESVVGVLLDRSRGPADRAPRGVAGRRRLRAARPGLPRRPRRRGPGRRRRPRAGHHRRVRRAAGRGLRRAAAGPRRRGPGSGDRGPARHTPGPPGAPGSAPRP